MPVNQSPIAKSAKAYAKFANRNPALGLLSYDLGKGILGKITKTLGRATTVRGGRAIQVTAGG